jgi:hypothetical protein
MSSFLPYLLKYLYAFGLNVSSQALDFEGIT